MIVLGIETATRICGVGLAGPEGLIAEYRIRGDNTHGEKLSQAVSWLLQNCGLDASRVEGVAVSIGPGSFTGLRIGLGFAKGFAYGLDLPLAAVPTMDALVSRIPDRFPNLCVLLPARKGEVYRGLFKWLNGSWALSSNIEDIEVVRLGDGFSDEETLFIGDGAVQYRDEIIRVVKKAVFFPNAFSTPSGFQIALCGREKLLSGERADNFPLVPQYVKRFQGVE